MTTKNIIIAPCGNKATIFNKFWLKDLDKKEFDICLLFYHENIENKDLYENVDFFYHLKNFKYHMLYDLLTNIRSEWLNEYEYFYFLDDDIEIETVHINEMFQLSHAHKTWISQASLSKDSFCSWPMFKNKKKSFCRFVGQVEVMAPLFSREALLKCLPSFNKNKSSWGVDSVWSKILDYPKNKLVVFDKVIMKHTLPVGGGELYEKIGISPHLEWNSITSMYNAKKHNYIEYGRLQIINSKTNRFLFYLIKIKEVVISLKRTITDYDLISRVKNKVRFFLL